MWCLSLCTWNTWHRWTGREITVSIDVNKKNFSLCRIGKINFFLRNAVSVLVVKSKHWNFFFSHRACSSLRRWHNPPGNPHHPQDAIPCSYHRAEVHLEVSPGTEDPQRKGDNHRLLQPERLFWIRRHYMKLRAEKDCQSSASYLRCAEVVSVYLFVLNWLGFCEFIKENCVMFYVKISWSKYTMGVSRTWCSK